MKNYVEICRQLSTGQFDFSKHAFKRTIERNISEIEIMDAGIYARVIKDYPEDKYNPSCLLLGFTNAGRPLHLQVSLAETEFVKIITIYEPDREKWIDFSKRR
ncbi:MAG: DUF4258 domain-containing protein [Nitrospirae bacterium]|nr:DUF4258 domain-containing protein [Nitrospirota bacterium]